MESSYYDLKIQIIILKNDGYPTMFLSTAMSRNIVSFCTIKGHLSIENGCL